MANKKCRWGQINVGVGFFFPFGSYYLEFLNQKMMAHTFLWNFIRVEWVIFCTKVRDDDY